MAARRDMKAVVNTLQDLERGAVAEEAVYRDALERDLMAFGKTNHSRIDPNRAAALLSDEETARDIIQKLFFSSPQFAVVGASKVKEKYGTRVSKTRHCGGAASVGAGRAVRAQC